MTEEERAQLLVYSIVMALFLGVIVLCLYGIWIYS